MITKNTPDNHTSIFSKRWVKHQKIDRGGQADVYKVVDKNTSEEFAAKVFSVNRNNKAKLARVKKEIALLKNLDGHSNIVRIYEDNIDSFNSEKGQIYYVMDYAKYGSLKNNDFYFGDVEVCLKLFKEILTGVKNAHDMGIIHRDLKPENILLFPSQTKVMISDFGISCLLDRSKDENITKEQEFLGPKYFISPEQFSDPSSVDERSDIYSLGKVLAFMLTGKGKLYRESFDLGNNFDGANPYIPLIQEKLLNKMITEEKQDRFSNVAEAIDELEKILDQISSNSKRSLEPKKNTSGNVFNILFEGDKRSKFIEMFQKDLLINIFILQSYTEHLEKTQKTATIETLYKDLYSHYPTGKTNLIIKCVETAGRDPKKLFSLVKKHEKQPILCYIYSKFFFDTNSFDLAHKWIMKAIGIENDRKLKIGFYNLLIRICKECQCDLPHKPDLALIELLRSSKNDDEINELCETLGDYYEQIGDKDRAVMFWNIVLNKKPYKKDLRFNCAYNSTDASLSLYHYHVHTTSFGADPGVLNNMGVLFDNNEMPQHSIKMYQEAFEMGNTLAGSNLASKYLLIGLKDDALNILKGIIRKIPHYDKRVDQVFGQITESEEDEKQKEEKLLATGKKINYHNTRFVQAIISHEKHSLEGFWRINSNDDYNIEISGNKILKFAGSSTEGEGIFGQNTIELTAFKLSSFKENYRFGKLYLVDNNNLKGYVKTDKNNIEITEITGERIIDHEKYKEDKSNRVKSLSDLYLNKFA